MKTFKRIVAEAMALWWAFMLISITPDLLGFTGVWNLVVFGILYILVFWVFNLNVKVNYTIRFGGKTYSLGT